MAGYEGKHKIPLNPTEGLGNLKHMITDGVLCIVQSNKYTQDPRVKVWQDPLTCCAPESQEPHYHLRKRKKTVYTDHDYSCISDLDFTDNTVSKLDVLSEAGADPDRESIGNLDEDDDSTGSDDEDDIK